MKINLNYSYITFLIFVILHENWTSGSSKIVYEDLKVPYVPHVVVNKSVNEFDYNQLQEAIMRTLQKKQNVGAGLTVIEESVQKGSTLYDYLKTNNNYNNPVIESESSIYNSQIKQENIENNYVNKIATTSTTPKIYAEEIPLTPVKLQSINLGGNTTGRFNNPYKDNFQKNIEIQKLEKITARSPVSFTHAPNVNGDLKCNLKSLRFITDGECYSKEPVIETVCADKCIQQATNKLRRNNIMNARMASPRKYPSLQALHCVEAGTTKQKVKLYCKNGAVINNVISVVTDCTCTMHSEQVFFHSLPPTPSSMRNRRTYLRNSRSRTYANSFKPRY